MTAEERRLFDLAHQHLDRFHRRGAVRKVHPSWYEIEIQDENAALSGLLRKMTRILSSPPEPEPPSPPLCPRCGKEPARICAHCAGRERSAARRQDPTDAPPSPETARRANERLQSAISAGIVRFGRAAMEIYIVQGRAGVVYPSLTEPAQGERLLRRLYRLKPRDDEWLWRHPDGQEMLAGRNQPKDHGLGDEALRSSAVGVHRLGASG